MALNNLTDSISNFFQNLVPQAHAASYSNDIGANQYKNSVLPQFTQPTAGFLQQLPIGAFDAGDSKPLVGPNPSGTARGNIARNKRWVPEQWSMSPSGDPNSNSLDLTPGTGIFAPAPNPAQNNVPLDDKEQFALRTILYRSALDNQQSFDIPTFDKDLAAYINQNPAIANDLQFWFHGPLAQHSYEEKMRLAFAQLGAKYGPQLKNTPIGRHYQGILK